MVEFPKTAQELDAAFLSEVTGEAIAGFSCEPIGNGLVGDSTRITLDFADKRRARRTLAAKFAAEDPTSRATAQALSLYRKEIGFYREIAPHVAIRTPQVHFAEFCADDGTFLLLMEDCAPARQGDQLSGCSLDEAREAVCQLAALHGPSMGRADLAACEFLRPDPNAREFATVGYPPACARFVETYRGTMGEDDLALVAQCAKHPEIFSDETGDETACVIHGDFRLDNMLFAIHSGAEPMVTLDWQTVTKGDPLIDLGYFLGAGIGAAISEAQADALIEAYRAALCVYGASDPGDIRKAHGFARGAIHGLTTAVFSAAFVEDNKRARAIFQSMAEGACALIGSIDAMRILE